MLQPKTLNEIQIVWLASILKNISLIMNTFRINGVDIFNNIFLK